MTRDIRRFRQADRRGFALPMVMIIVFILAGALAAGFTMTRAERQIDDALRADVFALSNAETGLQRAMVDRSGIGLASGTPPANDSVRVTLTNGYADVIVTRVRPAVGAESPVYLVRSHGFSTASRVAGTPAAQYTVTQLASWQKGTMTVKAAFMSITGIAKNGTSGEISGVDDCGVKSNVAGVAVPDTPSYTQSGGSWSSVLSGSPLVDSTMGATPAAMAPNVGVDWASMTSGGQTWDFTVTQSGSTFSGFPTTSWFAANPTAFPTIYVGNNSTTPFVIPDGRGMLVIRNNAEISGNDVWSGVVLIGGTVTSNGNNTIAGALITGLNVKLGETVGVNAVGNGNKDFSYNSCAVESAMAGMGRMKVFKNTWGNNYSVY